MLRSPGIVAEINLDILSGDAYLNDVEPVLKHFKSEAGHAIHTVLPGYFTFTSARR